MDAKSHCYCSAGCRFRTAGADRLLDHRLPVALLPALLCLRIRQPGGARQAAGTAAARSAAPSTAPSPRATAAPAPSPAAIRRRRPDPSASAAPAPTSIRSLSTTEFSSSRNQVGADLDPRHRKRVQRPRGVRADRFVGVLHGRLQVVDDVLLLRHVPDHRRGDRPLFGLGRRGAPLRSSSRCSPANSTNRSW